jgi:iron-regulated transporter 1
MLLQASFYISAIQVALLAQNSLLLICATTVTLLFFFWDSIYSLWDGYFIIFLQSIIVLTAAMSRIASVGTTIIVEKDWIIILAEGDLNHLASRWSSICHFLIIYCFCGMF